MFLSCLQEAITRSEFQNINLKPKQVVCIEAIFNNRDTIAVLPTGYGKSLIYKLLPSILEERNARLGTRTRARTDSVQSKTSAVVLVVCPINSLIEDQLNKINDESNLSAAVLKVKKCEETNVDEEIQFLPGLKDAIFNLLFLHPEACLSSKNGFKLLRSPPYQKGVQAIVVDEAHCILEWGKDFRPDFGKLGMLCALFPTVPVLALTATASKKDREIIKETLHMQNVFEVTESPNRANIFYKKVFRVGGQSIEAYESILEPVANSLLQQRVEHPLTIIYLGLKWCGFAYRLFEKILRSAQYYPDGAEPIHENRIFAQFHAPQTATMKDQIMKELSSTNPKIRVVFATVAMGMGVDIPAIKHIIHIGPPHTVREYVQETGRAGRNGSQSEAVLYYDNHDLAANRKGISNEIKTYCHLEGKCMREFLLDCLDATLPEKAVVGHLCCSNCMLVCQCSLCH